MPYISGGMNYGNPKRRREAQRKAERESAELDWIEDHAAEREEKRQARLKEKQKIQAEQKQMQEWQEKRRKELEPVIANFECYLKQNRLLEMLSLLDVWGAFPEIIDRVPAQVLLCYAVKNKILEKVNRALLELKADVSDDGLPSFPTYADYQAAITTKMLRYLRERKAEISRTDQVEGIPIVFQTILIGNINFDIFKSFLDKDIDFKKLHDKNGLSALHYAAKANNYMVMEYLLENKCDVNQRDNNGLTPCQYLHITDGYESFGDCQISKYSCLDLLVKHGAKFLVPQEESSAYFALEHMILLAAQDKNVELIKMLLASVKKEDMQRLRLAAIKNQSYELFSMLLVQGLGEDDSYELMWAAIKISDCKLLRMIASFMKQPEHPWCWSSCQYMHGDKLLEAAIWSGSVDVVSTLVELGFDVQTYRATWEKTLDQCHRAPMFRNGRHDAQIREFLTSILLKSKLAEYKKQALEEDKQQCCFWKCSSTAPLKRFKAAEILNDVLEKKQELAALDKFGRLFSEDAVLNSFREQVEYVIKPKEEKSTTDNWPGWLRYKS